MDTKIEMIKEFKGMQKRESTFPIKMTADEITILKGRANRFGMSAGAYLRFLLHKDVERDEELIRKILKDQQKDAKF